MCTYTYMHMHMYMYVYMYTCEFQNKHSGSCGVAQVLGRHKHTCIPVFVETHIHTGVCRTHCSLTGIVACFSTPGCKRWPGRIAARRGREVGVHPGWISHPGVEDGVRDQASWCTHRLMVYVCWLKPCNEAYPPTLDAVPLRMHANVYTGCIHTCQYSQLLYAQTCE